MRSFDKSWAADVQFDTTDATKPVGLINIEQSFGTALLNSVMQPFTAGSKVATGLGSTVGEIGKMWAGHVVSEAIENKFGVNLNPF